MEEFQESEVLWPEESVGPIPSGRLHFLHRSMSDVGTFQLEGYSSPIEIPNFGSRSWHSEFTDYRSHDIDDDSGGGGEAIVPPHIVLARRRCNGKMAFSVCTGNGRTLKGRDLREFRDYILRLTGFLEI